MSSDEITPNINENNVEAVRSMIQKKQSSCPFYANMDSATQVITDIDHFPYTRFYRGVSYYPEPIVFEREAGWRNIKNNCYGLNKPCKPSPYPEHCFEAACSTVYPCRPDIQQKYADIDALKVRLNDSCIVQYR